MTLLGMIVWTSVAIALAVEGNLTETDKERELRRTSLGIGPSIWESSDVRINTDAGLDLLLSDDEQERTEVEAACEIAKRNMTESIKVCYSKFSFDLENGCLSFAALPQFCSSV